MAIDIRDDGVNRDTMALVHPFYLYNTILHDTYCKTVTFAHIRKFENTHTHTHTTRTSIGTFSKANGDKYHGMCKMGKANGKGIVTYADGERYKGNWLDDQRWGRGICVFPDGSTYKGE